MSIQPFFSVIIPTYNRTELLDRCLYSILCNKQTIDCHFYEIIVTDDGTNNDSEKLVLSRYPTVRWVSGPRLGPGANRNNGASIAKGQWLAFIDDDCLADPQWLETYHLAIVNNPNTKVFEGRVYAERPRSSLAEYAPLFETGGHLPSGNFVIEKHVFNSLNGFDESFTHAREDCDFAVRLQKAGFDFYFLKNAAVCHPWRTRTVTGDDWKSHKDSLAALDMFIQKHPDQIRYFKAHQILRRTLSRLVRETIPAAFKYKFHGYEIAIYELKYELDLLLYTIRRGYF